MYARPFIDSLDFAENGRQMDAQVPFAEFPRLHDALADTDGQLHYRLQGGQDQRGRPVLDIEMEGDCRLVCQRCLGAMDYAVSHRVRLLLCDEAELDALDSETDEHEEDEFEAILADAHLDVTALLEEEILLSLPISPMHDQGACQAAEGVDALKGKGSPFAILANLKRN